MVKLKLEIIIILVFISFISLFLFAIVSSIYIDDLANKGCKDDGWYLDKKLDCAYECITKEGNIKIKELPNNFLTQCYKK